MTPDPDPSNERDSDDHQRAAVALHSTATALMEAGTPEEAAEIAVEAVRDILGLPCNAAHLHDEASDGLRPVAWTDELEALVGDPPTFAPGDGLAWEVFETGEAQVHDDVSAVPGRYTEETAVRSEILLPLGDHGVLLVGSADTGAFDGSDVSLARTVAAHATTALDRIDREEQLRAERAFSDQALDALEDIFYVVGPDGRMRRWNERLVAVTGYDDEEIADMQAVEFFPEDQREQVAEAIDGTLSEGRTIVEADLLAADGQRVPHEFTGTRLTGPDGELAGVVGIGRDVSRRNERERALRRERERFGALFESIPRPVVHVRFVDAEPVVQNVNAAFEEVFGHDTATVAGESLDEYIVPDGRETGAQEINRRSEAGEAIEREVRRLAADGERTFLFRVVQTDTGHGRTEAVGMYVDITERKRRERRLRRQNERLDRFASVVSHDLQNPLNVAMGYLGEVRDDLDRPELDVVAESLDRMEALVDDLLTLARTGQQVQSVETVDLAELADSCWETVETADATLVVDTDRRVRADRGRLRQLLENLFGNAAEHAGDDVTVTVGDLPGGFYVGDDGPGIPPDEREAVFESGYSGSSDGTGFGLAIVQEIARAHGWTVDVTCDGGTRFEVAGVETGE
jgi:PAS domain S-box-containing protein